MGPAGSFALAAPELCIVVPTFNEHANVVELVRRVSAVLAGRAWELIFVDDDSTDGTAAEARALSRRMPNVRCVRRVGRRGLGSACIEGMLATSAPLVAVMDADLQHDEQLLARMVDVLKADPHVDVVIGSRYVEGGGTGTWASSRVRASRIATALARRVTHTGVADPMSGFFMLRLDTVHELVPRLSGIGFKILLDVLASSPRPLRCVELPYVFRERIAGESKLDNRVIWDYLMLLADKTVGRWVPVRFLSFGIVGGLGVGVHLAALSALYVVAGVGFALAQALATLVAMTFNFLLNNALTWRDRKLHGVALLRGWLSFVAACSIGALANVGVAAYLFSVDTFWMLSALAGIAVGVVWNYAVTATYTWRASA